MAMILYSMNLDFDNVRDQILTSKEAPSMKA